MFYDEELPAGFQDADLEMAEMERDANAMRAAQARGECQHSSSCGVSSDGTIYYPEQVGLTGTQRRCTENTGGCAEVFADDEDWYDAMDAARSNR